MIRRDALDSFDLKLLDLLQADSQRPVAEMAAAVGLSAPACYRRIRRLRASGVIEREVALVRPRTLGWPLSMIVLVALERETAQAADEMAELMAAEPEVLEAWSVTGDYGFALRIVARDMEGYDRLTHRLLTENDLVRTFRTLVVFREVKGRSPVPTEGGW